MSHVSSFTFNTYSVNTARSIVTFTYRVEFSSGRIRTYTDRLYLHDIAPTLWDTIPKQVLESTLQALLLMLGINYWCVFPTRNIHIEGFSLTKEQAEFWDSLYLNGLGEFFYNMKKDFRNLIAFPYNPTATCSTPSPLKQMPGYKERALLLNGAGKDSILSAELLKSTGTPFDFFSFAPTPAHTRIGKLVGAKTISVTRRRDPRITIRRYFGMSGAYPSVSTFTFIATLLAELLGYNSIIFSNEKSADFGNLTYLGLPINHQWCKSSEAEKLVNDYIHTFITPHIRTYSLLRTYSELEIVRRFVKYPQYLHYFTSCNNYFWLPRYQQLLSRKSYWCKECPKCIFLFACFAAYLPKKEMVSIFGADLYRRKRHLPVIKKILGLEGFKPLDCVGEPEEMILAMHKASVTGQYAGEPAMQLFEKHFSHNYDYETLEQTICNP